MGRPFRLGLNDGRSPVRRTAASENRTVTRPPGRRHLSSRPACSSPARRQRRGAARGLSVLRVGFPRGAASPDRPVEDDLFAGAAWLVSARRRCEPGTVASLVPAVFEAYRPRAASGDRYDGDDDVEVTWAEVAAFNGRTRSPRDGVDVDHRVLGVPRERRPARDLGRRARARATCPAPVAARLAAVLAAAHDDPGRLLVRRLGRLRLDGQPSTASHACSSAAARTLVLRARPGQRRRRATWPPSPPSRARTCGGRPTGPGASSPTST